MARIGATWSIDRRTDVRRRLLALAATAVVVVGCSGDDASEGGGASGDFCTDFAAFEVVQAEGDELFVSGAVDPEEFREVFGRFSAAIDAVVASAPDAIDSDLRLVSDTTRQLIDAFERADYDFTALATDPQYADVLLSLDDDRITEANDRLAMFVRDECGPTPNS